MSEERQKATFNVRELTYFLDGGEKFTKVTSERTVPCSRRSRYSYSLDHRLI